MIRKLLDISTGHVSKETRDLLNEGEGGSPHIWAIPHEYGWFVRAHDEAEDLAQTPDDLVTVMRYAKQLDCDWIKFDCDADFVEELPMFEW